MRAFIYFKINYLIMFKCPICHKPGIPTWRKLCLGPALPTKCRECGKKVGVPYSSMLAVVPFVVAILISWYIFLYTDYSLLYILLSLIIGNIIMFFLYLKWVTLIPKE
jgi:hypothetical protein